MAFDLSGEIKLNIRRSARAPARSPPRPASSARRN